MYAVQCTAFVPQSYFNKKKHLQQVQKSFYGSSENAIPLPTAPCPLNFLNSQHWRELNSQFY